MMDVGAALIANCQPAKAIEPSETAFDDPAMAAKFLLALNASTGNARQNAAASTSFATARIIIAFVGVALPRPAQRTSRFSRNGRNGIEHFFKHGAVVNICTSQTYGERCAAPVRHQESATQELPLQGQGLAGTPGDLLEPVTGDPILPVGDVPGDGRALSLHTKVEAKPGGGEPRSMKPCRLL